MSNGNDLVSACAPVEDSSRPRQLQGGGGGGNWWDELEEESIYMNIWSLETRDDSIVVNELNF